MISAWDIGWRLLLAALLGGVIGLDRERHEWAAGLRTHMLVCMGAALVVIVSAYGFSAVLALPHMVLDPSRIAAQVISGIGFLGAGTILFVEHRQMVRGLTTAAGLWAVAAIGLAAGAGLYAAAVFGTAMAWAILVLLKPLQRRVLARRADRLRLTMDPAAPSALAAVAAIVAQRRLPLARIVLKPRADGDQLTLRFNHPLRREQLLGLAEALRVIEGLRSVTLPGAGRADEAAS
ncbi:MgtC/SapB family protein [Aerosticca soli]|uniref:Protein MgtC n=1 Tax=Aerosticca soli TaxID=2010829 RepID=A0A2Z6E8P6_9GAMM|nr:MgtC/SapB family protein [Aerosticca soli]BBD81151.1 Mg(2+) transport ATPase protein C [Aerosticca soli]